MDAGGVQVDPPGWLRAPYSPGPNSQANDFITKRVEMLKSFLGTGDQKRQRPEAGTPGGGVRGGEAGGWRQEEEEEEEEEKEEARKKKQNLHTG